MYVFFAVVICAQQIIKNDIEVGCDEAICSNNNKRLCIAE